MEIKLSQKSKLFAVKVKNELFPMQKNGNYLACSSISLDNKKFICIICNKVLKKEIVIIPNESVDVLKNFKYLEDVPLTWNLKGKIFKSMNPYSTLTVKFI